MKYTVRLLTSSADFIINRKLGVVKAVRFLEMFLAIRVGAQPSIPAMHWSESD